MAKIGDAYRTRSLVALLLLMTVTVAAPASAASQTKVLGGGQVFLATGAWSEQDAQGNAVFTRIDVLAGLVFDQAGEEHFGQGTTITLLRTTFDANGNSVFTDNEFFGTMFTTTPVLTIDKSLKTATLAPVTVNDCMFDEVGNCSIVLKQATIAASWTGTGTLATT